MANNFIQVAADSTGKKMQTYLNTIGGNDVHSEAVVLVDDTGTPLGVTNGALNVALANVTLNASINTAGLATSLAQTNGGQKTQIADPVNASNVAGVTNGALNVYLGVLAPFTVIQSNASNLAATVSQGGTWNIGTVTSITNPVTAIQSNASNLAATVSGTVTANAGTNLNTSLLALDATSTSGAQKTQIVDPVNASNAAGVTAGALNVYLASITANAGTNLNTANTSIKVFQGASTVASGQVTMSNVSTTILGSRPTRRSGTIRNQDSLNSGYIGPAPIGTGNGLLLAPRDSISIDYVGIIAGISATTNNVTFGYLETYD